MDGPHPQSLGQSKPTIRNKHLLSSNLIKVQPCAITYSTIGFIGNEIASQQIHHVEKSTAASISNDSGGIFYRDVPPTPNTPKTLELKRNRLSYSDNIDYVRVISIVCHFVATSKLSKPCPFWYCFSTIPCCMISYSRRMHPSTSFRRPRISRSKAATIPLQILPRSSCFEKRHIRILRFRTTGPLDGTVV